MNFSTGLVLFRRYRKEYGFLNTLTISLYVLFPRIFFLVGKKIMQAGVSSAGAAGYEHAIKSVYDFQSWKFLGGNDKAKKLNARKVFVWFVPDWTNVWGGGHYTLFRFANHFSKNDCKNIIYIYNGHGRSSSAQLQEELDNALPDCRLEVIIDPAKLPECDGAIATTWQSAYFVKSFPFAKHKFYFMQDYESLFYAYGTASMQANATYEFGFSGVTGGGWLRQCYESHGGKAINYRFAADRKIFHPANENGTVRDRVKKVFFYGRPSTERRCFDLGIASLAKIAKKYPEIEIVIAGLDLNEPPPFPATLLGNMTLAATGDLYRTCDIGIAFSGTNLSYLPVELMASGVPVLSNNGPHVEWHCKHMENSYLSLPVPEAMLDSFSQLVESKDLRQKLVNGGLETMAHLSWEDEMQKIYEYCNSLTN